MRIHEFIIEGYKEAQAEFQKFTSADNVSKVIDQYRQLVNRNQFSGDERNIDYWRKQGWDAFSDRVAVVATTPSKTQVKRSKLAGKSITLKEDDNWLIVIPLDKDASCFHGKDTDWCTTKQSQDYFEKYFYESDVTLIYLINKQDSGHYAIASHPNLTEIEMFNQSDDPVTAEEFQEETGFDPNQIVKLAHEKYKPEISASRDKFKQYIARIRGLYYNDASQRSKELEELLIYTKRPEYCAWYIDENGTGEYPEPITLCAIKYNESLIKNVTNISDGMLRTILKMDSPKIFRDIKRDIPVDIQMALVKNDLNTIRYLEYPDEQVQRYVIQQDPSKLSHIINASPAIELEAIKQRPILIATVYSQTPALQMAAVMQDPMVIEYIHSPTSEVQLTAYKNADRDDRGAVFVYVKNKSPELIAAHRGEQWGLYMKAMISGIKKNIADGTPSPIPMAKQNASRTMGSFLDKVKTANRPLPGNVQLLAKQVSKFLEFLDYAESKSANTA